MIIDYHNLGPVTIDITGPDPVIVDIILPLDIIDLTIYLVNSSGTMIQPEYVSPGNYRWIPTRSLLSTDSYWFEGIEVMSGSVYYKSPQFEITAVKPPPISPLVGVYYTPEVSDQGIISWTNNGGLPNPSPKDIMGDSYVYVGSSTPTDPIKTIWIDSDNSTP